jgi:polyisoprenoid-binding protein YceI
MYFIIFLLAVFYTPRGLFRSLPKAMIKIKPTHNLGHFTPVFSRHTFVQNLVKMKCKFVVLFFFTISFAFGQGNYRVSNYYLVIKGTSNLHDWESKANEVRANGNLTVDAAGALKSIQSLYVEIPVKTIKSAKGSIMDNKTYDALKADAFPNITFKLEKVTGLGKRGDIYDVNAVGNLTIAGSTQKIDIYVQGKLDGNGGVTFNGSKKLKMTDYKINPPTALMGTMTTGNEVEIAFQVTLKQF